LSKKSVSLQCTELDKSANCLYIGLIVYDDVRSKNT